MKDGRRVWIVVLLIATLAGVLPPFAAGSQGALAAQGTIIYVDADARGLDDGETWRNAYTNLQDALDEAEAGNQIWVAAGTYKPTRRVIDDDPRSATFQMVNGVELYGGFGPDEGVTKFDERDWVAYETILSGNIGDEDRSDDNSHHVWYNPLDVSLDGTATLDGFIITAGNADSLAYPNGVCGGGLYNEGSWPTLRNITFLNNSAGYGGALWVSASYAEEATLALTNVTFVDNWATKGGSVYIDATEARPADVFIFTNCIFRGNAAERGGAAYIALGEADADTPPIRFTNCTFHGNLAELGTAFYVSEGPGEGWLAVTNSILWGDGPNEIYLEDGVRPPLVTYSDVEGDYEGDTNINEDPSFVEPDSGDLHLQPDSPCIDVGSNEAPNLPLVDFEGDNRIGDGNGDGHAVVDIGADEFMVSTIRVEIDITPNTPNNIIKLSSEKLVPVAILSDQDLDAPEDVIRETVRFAGAPIANLAVHDVDDDGDLDLLVYFYPAEMVELTLNSKEATLTGVTNHKTDFEGTDRVKVKE